MRAGKCCAFHRTETLRASDGSNLMSESFIAVASRITSNRTRVMTRSMSAGVFAFALLACVSAPSSAQTAAGAEAPQPLPSVTLPPALDRVLRDYEKHWAAGNLAELAKLFTEDGFVLQNGKMPVRGREAIKTVYGG